MPTKSATEPPCYREFIGSEEHYAQRRFSIPSCSPTLLVVGTKWLGWRRMEDETDIRFVHTHAKGDGSHQDAGLLRKSFWLLYVRLRSFRSLSVSRILKRLPENAWLNKWVRFPKQSIGAFVGFFFSLMKNRVLRLPLRPATLEKLIDNISSTCIIPNWKIGLE